LMFFTALIALVVVLVRLALSSGKKISAKSSS
jgi:hypothetical protein